MALAVRRHDLQVVARSRPSVLKFYVGVDQISLEMNGVHLSDQADTKRHRWHRP